IYSDSDVIYDTPQMKNTVSLTIHGGKSDQVKKIMESLQASGSSVSLGTATEGSSRLNIDTTMDMLGLYNFFNGETFTSGQAKFKAPVVAYAENTMEIEVTDFSKPPTRPRPAKPPAPRPAHVGNSTAGDDFSVGKGEQIAQLKTRIRPAVTLRLKPISYNK